MIHVQPPPSNVFPGFLELESYLQNVDIHTQNILRTECSVLLECRLCASIFRSIPNFVHHKTKYCCKDQNNHAETKLRRSNSDVPLRRVNIVRYFMNESYSVETNMNGCMDTVDLNAVPEFRRQVTVVPCFGGETRAQNVVKDPSLDEVLMVMPQDLPIRYRDVNLERSVGEQTSKKITILEADCINRMNELVRIDPMMCRCLADGCREILPFKSIFTLAFHVAVKHCQRIPPHNVIPCVICGKAFITWETYYKHVEEKHEEIRGSHQYFRGNNSPKKRGRTTNVVGTNSNILRTRSMSPVMSGKECDKEETLAYWKRIKLSEDDIKDVAAFTSPIPQLANNIPDCDAQPEGGTYCKTVDYDATSRYLEPSNFEDKIVFGDTKNMREDRTVCCFDGDAMSVYNAEPDCPQLPCCPDLSPNEDYGDASYYSDHTFGSDHECQLSKRCNELRIKDTSERSFDDLSTIVLPSTSPTYKETESVSSSTCSSVIIVSPSRSPGEFCEDLDDLENALESRSFESTSSLWEIQDYTPLYVSAENSTHSDIHSKDEFSQNVICSSGMPTHSHSESCLPRCRQESRKQSSQRLRRLAARYGDSVYGRLYSFNDADDEVSG